MLKEIDSRQGVKTLLLKGGIVIATILGYRPDTVQAQSCSPVLLHMFAVGDSEDDIGDELGFSIAVKSNVVVVGLPGDSDFGNRDGSVMFVDLYTGQLIEKISNVSGDGANVGWSVATDGFHAIVGAPGEDYISSENVGAVYIFEPRLSGHTVFRGTSLEPYSRFGHAVYLHENILMMSVPGESRGGFVYVYEVVDWEDYTLLATLRAPDSSSGDYFGSSLTAFGDRLYVGASNHSEMQGAVYEFDRDTGEFLSKFASDGVVGQAKFGTSIAASEQYLVVGAPFDDQLGRNSGAVHVFNRGNGELLYRLTEPDGQGRWRFGTSVAITDDLLHVGAPDAGDQGEGRVYSFEIATGDFCSWIAPSLKYFDSRFGFSMAVDGSTLCVGAPQHGGAKGYGAAYMYEAGDRAWFYSSPRNLRSGQPATVKLVNGTPDSSAWLLSSFDGLGEGTYIPQLDVTVDLVNPRIALGPGTTDAFGYIEHTAIVPPVSQVQTIWLQAVQPGVVSNYVESVVIP